MTGITVTPVSPVVGAEVRGVDLASPISDDTFAEVLGAFHEHGVLFFKDSGPIEPETQVAFASRLGPLHTHPAAPTLEGHDAIFVIHTHKDSRVSNGNGWHSDVSCDEEPPLGTMLQLHQLPPAGGDTLFACMAAAYDALSGPMKNFVSELTALHSSEHVYRGRYADRGVDDTDKVYPEAEHPVVRTHPVTGRQALYVNRGFTTKVLGLSPHESRSMLHMLFEHCERNEFQVRHRWDVNDVVLWDNRRLQHFAMWDYWPHERKGHRVTVKGDRPFHRAGGEPRSSTLRVSSGQFWGARRRPARCGCTPDQLDAGLARCGDLVWQLTDELESEPLGDTTAGHVRGVVVDLDAVDVGLRQRFGRGHRNRAGHVALAGVRCIDPVPELDATRAHAAVRSAHSDELPAEADAVGGVVGLGPAGDERPAVIEAERFGRLDPGHPRAQVLEVGDDEALERGCVVDSELSQHHGRAIELGCEGGHVVDAGTTRPAESWQYLP